MKRNAAWKGELQRGGVDKPRFRLWLWLALVSALLLSGPFLGSAQAGRDPLLEVLIKKGILTAEEAAQIEKEARALERVREQQVEQKVKAAESKVVEQVDKKLAAVDQKVEKKAEAWKVPEALKGLKVGTLAYIDYSTGSRPIANGRSTGFNQWTIGRGYLNVQKEITPWLHVRYTPDLTLDANGDWKLRQKYVYAEFRPPNLGNYLTHMKCELGLGHIPWLDFEEHINPYRCQGTMAVERAGVFNSADLGLNIRGYFGGRLPEAKKRVGDDHYDGLYGSWHVGLYNGGGYHAPERNHNKVIEYRVTVRPLPQHLPGLQASYFGLYGKGNSSSAANFANQGMYDYFPDWLVHLGMLSFQHPRIILTAQMFATKGNQAGNWTTTPGIPGKPIGQRANSLWTRGYSVFADLKLPLKIFDEERLHVFYRTDWFNADQDQVISKSARYTKLITGVACYIYKKNFITLGYEKTWYGRDYGRIGGTGFNGTSARVASPASNGTRLGQDDRFQTVYQISF